MLSAQPQMHGLLSGGMGCDPGMLRVDGLIVRGGRASKASNLGLLRNVGGMVKESHLFSHTEYSAKALVLLDRDPLDINALAALPADKLTRERDSAMWSKHLLVLERSQVLEWCEKPKSFATSICGKYTAVWKDVKETEEKSVARAIFDLRRLNLVTTAVVVDFALLAAVNMVPLLMGIGPRGGARWRIVHADVSNMYYQLGVGKDLGSRCLLRFGGRYMSAKVLPMGFKKSCGIAQGLSMGLILRVESGDRDLGIPSSAYLGGVAPGYIRLTNGGIIFLVYDSILIICPEDDARAWQRRLRRNFETRANLLFKYCEVADVEEVVPYCGLELRMTPKGLQWRVGDQSVATWKILRHVQLKRCPRTLFRIVGFSRFAAAIQGVPRHKLGAVSKIQSSLGLVQNWDETCLREEDIAVAWEFFDAMVEERYTSKTKGWRHRRSHLPIRTRDTSPSTCIIAVDATPYRWAVNLLRGAHDVDISRHGDFDDLTPNADAESRSSKEGLLLALDESFGVIVLCNDHRSVGPSFWKGYSTKPVIQADIRGALDRVVEEKIIFVDVPTKENFADVDTRPDKKYSAEEINQRRRDTLRRANEALEVWKQTGKDYFSREDVVWDESDQEIDEYESEND